MKIVLVAPASSIHTVRWANSLASLGHEVHLISQHKVSDLLLKDVKTHICKYRGQVGYFLMVPYVRSLLKKIRPDILNAHYASGYGTTARLVNYHPWVISVWGSDVYEFPRKSLLHKWLIKRNLLAADKVASTSHCMADEASMLASELIDIAITPFGVNLFAYTDLKPNAAIKKSRLVIGTVKTMTKTYGIDTLLEAYALLLKSLQSRPDAPDLELRLVGEGNQTAELQALAKQLGISQSVIFVGRVPHNQVPQELAKLDIYVALSRAESFGVSVIEAGAAGRPVVVSDAAGLLEVTVDGHTGFVVPRENPTAASQAIERMVLDAELRHRMGAAGQNHVAKKYSWNVCIETMLDVYKKTISDLQN